MRVRLLRYMKNMYCIVFDIFVFDQNNLTARIVDIPRAVVYCMKMYSSEKYYILFVTRKMRMSISLLTVLKTSGKIN